MLDKIIEMTQNDPRVRAVYLEGSRANSRVKPDQYQDYDIGVIVHDVEAMISDDSFIKQLGEVLYSQEPEKYTKPPRNNYPYLLQLKSGNRVDLSIKTLEVALEQMDFYEILIDKDNVFEFKKQNSDKKYWAQKPTQVEFNQTTNEFWWCLNNVSKGIMRDELPYAIDMVENYLRPMMTKVLGWYIGYQNNYQISIGKAGKYLKEYLTQEQYEEYLMTYSLAEKNLLIQSVQLLCELFDFYAQEVSENNGLHYNQVEANNSFNHFNEVTLNNK